MANIPIQYSDEATTSPKASDQDPAPTPTTDTPISAATVDAVGSPPGIATTPAPLPRISVRGGNMAMRVLSRVMQDLDLVTGGTRAATYEEADEHVAERF